MISKTSSPYSSNSLPKHFTIGHSYVFLQIYVWLPLQPLPFPSPDLAPLLCCDLEQYTHGPGTPDNFPGGSRLHSPFLLHLPWGMKENQKPLSFKSYKRRCQDVNSYLWRTIPRPQQTYPIRPIIQIPKILTFHSTICKQAIMLQLCVYYRHHHHAPTWTVAAWLG